MSRFCMRMKSFVVIPAYEPNKNLINLCEELISKEILNIVIVDDGSIIGQDIFTKLSDMFPFITILHHKSNRGKGRALKTAFEYLLKNTDAECCVTADSDGQHKVCDIISCLQTANQNPNTFVLGCRQFDWSSTPFKSKIGNKFTLKLFTLLIGNSVSDTQTGLRCLNSQMMKECLDLEGERFEFEMNMLVTFLNKYPVKEVPVHCVYEKSNKGTHFKPLIDSFKVIKAMHSASKRADLK